MYANWIIYHVYASLNLFVGMLVSGGSKGFGPYGTSSKCSTYNPNVKVAQNYSIVKDLAQSSYAMSALEVHQLCPI